MADTQAEPTAPDSDTAGGMQQVAVIHPLPAVRRTIPQPRATTNDANGQPIVEPPPLIEPIEFAASTVQRPPTATSRPIRRQFLAPPAAGGTAGENRPRPILEPRRTLPTGPGSALPPPRGDHANPQAALRARAAAAPEPDDPATRRPPVWLRRLTVAVGIVVALSAAIALELGAGPDRLNQLYAIVAQKFTGLPPSEVSPPADPAQRIAYYGERAKKGDADAQLALAILYAKGDGIPQNYAAAARWFRAAADKGSVRAQYDLGVLYERGRGVPVDPVQAVSWYRKAAEQNHPLAQYNLAVAFTKGQGVRQDFFEAAVWYHRAAAQGVVAAMVNLAILYERGEGVAASTVDAYAWYRAAARRGSQPAARRGDELLQAFGPLDQSRAEAKAADIAASIRDSIGERARVTARSPAPAATPAAADDSAAPTLKSGMERAPDGPADKTTAAANP